MMLARAMRLARRPGVGWLAASVALGIAAIATLGGTGSSPSQAVVVARSEIPAGVRLTAEAADALLERVDVSRSRPLAGVLESPSQVVGETVAVGLAAGELVTRGALEGRTDVGLPPLATGERAISVQVATPGAGVRSGARVDVVASRPDETLPARVVVPAAEVLALDEHDPVAAAQTVSLRVSAAEALEIASAAGTGFELRLLLRSTQEAAGQGPGP